MDVDQIISVQFEPTLERWHQVATAFFVDKLTDGAKAYLWAEAVDGWSFAKWQGWDQKITVHRAGQEANENSGSAAQWLPGTLAGQLFTSNLQLHWRQITVESRRWCRMVFMGQFDPTSLNTDAFDAVEVLEKTDTTSLGLTTQEGAETYWLWGQQTESTPGEWIELSIPHRFQYSQLGASAEGDPRRLAIEGKRWVDRSGRLHFLRYTGLVAAG